MATNIENIIAAPIATGASESNAQGARDALDGERPSPLGGVARTVRLGTLQGRHAIAVIKQIGRAPTPQKAAGVDIQLISLDGSRLRGQHVIAIRVSATRYAPEGSAIIPLTLPSPFIWGETVASGLGWGLFRTNPEGYMRVILSAAVAGLQGYLSVQTAAAGSGVGDRPVQILESPAVLVDMT